jgi:hypothetical protein
MAPVNWGRTLSDSPTRRGLEIGVDRVQHKTRGARLDQFDFNAA